jgi:succinate dehydrogenase / fumarate reductase, cytochrome b subunit
VNDTESELHGPEFAHGDDSGRASTDACRDASPANRLHRPVFLDLLRIQMPVGALASIGHRISGVVLAASLPVAVYLFGLSLANERGFAEVRGVFGGLGFKAAAVILVWALSHHMLGGARHLLSDFDVGSSLRYARHSAWFVNLAAPCVALLAAVVVW